MIALIEPQPRVRNRDKSKDFGLLREKEQLTIRAFLDTVDGEIKDDW